MTAVLSFEGCVKCAPEHVVEFHPALPLYSISHISLSPSSLARLADRPLLIRALLTLDSHNTLKKPITGLPKQEESMHHPNAENLIENNMS